MRISLRIALTAVYLLLTVGLSVATHFCGNEPVSTGLLSHAPAEPADCCGDDEPMDGCCSTVVTTLQLNDAHVLNIEWTPQFVSTDLPDMMDTPPVVETDHIGVPCAAGPPGEAPPLHILHATLLI